MERIVHLLGLERRLVHACHLAMQTNDGRLPAAEMKVGCALLDHRAQQHVERGARALTAVEGRDRIAGCTNRGTSRSAVFAVTRGRARRSRLCGGRSGLFLLRQLDSAEMPRQPLALAILIEGDACMPPGAVVLRVDGKRAVLGRIRKESGLEHVK